MRFIVFKKIFRRYYFLAVVLGVLIFAGLVYYFSFKIQSSLKKKEKQTSLPSDKVLSLQSNYEKMKNHVIASQPEVPETACFQIKTDPLLGAVIRTEVDQQNQVYDFTYTGKVIDLQKLKENNCEYYQLSLKKPNNFEYALLFPQDLYFQDPNLGLLSGEVFEDFIDKEVELTLTWQKKESDLWQVQKWHRLRFYIN